jgi:hypothetical protein
MALDSMSFVLGQLADPAQKVQGAGYALRRLLVSYYSFSRGLLGIRRALDFMIFVFGHAR